MKPIVQISLDIFEIPEALATAEMALKAGVDWLEAGSPKALTEFESFVTDLPIPQ